MPKKTTTPNVEIRAESIRLTFWWNHARHRETLALHPTPPNVKHAVRLQRSIEDDVALGRFTLEDYARHFPDSPWLRRTQHAKRGDQTITASLEAWFGLMKALKPSTAKRYRSAMREFTDRWGGVRPSELTLTMIRQWIAGRQEAGITLKTIKNQLIPLRGMLQEALANEVIEANPLDKLPDLDPSEAERVKRLTTKIVEPFELSELDTILAACTKMEVANFIEFEAWSGLRTGEMFGLAWEDIDLHRGTAQIVRTITEGRWLTPKTKAGARTLDLLPRALAVLKRQKALTFLLPPVDAGPFGQLRPVFRQPGTGKQWRSSNTFAEGYWRPLLRKAGVRYRYPYQLRHTFASMCISVGENERWLADYLGHTDTSMIRRHYAKWLKEAAEHSGQKGGSKISLLMKEVV